MKNTKERNNYLMQLADRAIRGTRCLFKNHKEMQIHDSYNGQIAAFSVAIAMSGLLPALANYYQDGEEHEVRTKVYLRHILTVISKMMNLDEAFELRDEICTAEGLLRFSINNPNAESCLRKEVIDCAIALKQVVRTYKLV